MIVKEHTKSPVTDGLGRYPCRCWFGIRSSADHTADDWCLAEELYKPPMEAGPSPEQFENYVDCAAILDVLIWLDKKVQEHFIGYNNIFFYLKLIEFPMLKSIYAQSKSKLKKFKISISLY